MAPPFYPIAGYSAAMSSRSLALSGALLVAVLVPASAQAAVINPLKPCYVTAGTAAAPQAEGVEISASGFTPNSKVDLAIDGTPVPNGAGLQTDPTGALNALPPVPAPFIPKGTRDFTVTLTEQGNPANVGTATAKTTALAVSVKPEKARPSKRIRFKGAGFTDDKPVYAHYVYKNKVRKTVRMARKHRHLRRPGASSARQIPVEDPGTGLWTVQFDQSKKYHAPGSPKLTGVYVRLQIRVAFVRNPG